MLWCMTIVLLFALFVSKCRQGQYTEQFYQSQTDSLHKYKNKLGQEVTITQSITGKYSDIKNLLKDKELEVDALYRKIKNITVVSSSTSGTVHGNVDIVNFVPNAPNSTDSAHPNHPCDSLPVYHSAFADEWLKLQVTVSPTNMTTEYSVINKYVITHKYVRDGLFKPKKLNVEIKNINPHTSTLDLNNYQIVKKQHKGIIFITGLLLGLTTNFL